MPDTTPDQAPHGQTLMRAPDRSSMTIHLTNGSGHYYTKEYDDARGYWVIANGGVWDYDVAHMRAYGYTEIKDEAPTLALPAPEAAALLELDREPEPKPEPDPIMPEAAPAPAAPAPAAPAPAAPAPAAPAPEQPIAPAATPEPAAPTPAPEA